ncbi:MAG: YetF domain-containing protein [Propionicimonas sp.]
MTDLDWLLPFLSIDMSVGEKILRTIAVYLAIAILIRVAGKRLLGQMNSLDLVVVLLLSNVVQNAIIGPDNSVAGGVLGAVVLVGFNAMMDRLSHTSPALRRVIVGQPTPLIEAGEVDQHALRRLGISTGELDLALRRQGSDEPSQVQRAALEPEGEIVVTLKPGERPATRDDLAAAVADLKALISAR